jgi:hypothetical protein
MPYTMTKTDGFRVTSPHGVKAKNTTAAKARRQMNLLRGVEHGWRPTGAPARKSLSDHIRQYPSKARKRQGRKHSLATSVIRRRRA